MVWGVFLVVLVVWWFAWFCRVVFGRVSRGTVCVVRAFWFAFATFFLLGDRVLPEVLLRHLGVSLSGGPGVCGMVRLTKEVVSAAVAAARGGNTKLARQIVNGEVPWNQPVLSRLQGERAREAAARAASEASSARGLDLESRLLRRWQQGKSVPEWFKPWESGNSLLKYQTARAGSGQMGLSAPFPKARFGAEKFAPPLAAAQARNAAVKKGVSATRVPMEKIREIQRLCGVQDNPRVCAKVADMIERQVGIVKTKGFYQNAQHSWNVMPDGTIVDATASQFGLPSINVVAPRAARARGYRQMTPEQVRYMEEAHLQGFPVRDNLDWLAGDFGRRKFEIDPWIAEGLDFDELAAMGYRKPWEVAAERAAELSRFFGMKYGQS